MLIFIILSCTSLLFIYCACVVGARSDEQMERYIKESEKNNE